MLKFFYSNGSSAVAAHILLEEVAAPYEAIKVSIPNGDHLAPEFLQINPKGRIPVLVTPQSTITENPAILEYIAATHKDGATLPLGHDAQAQARSLAAYLCATAHVAFAHNHRGRRWAEQDASVKDMQSNVARNLTDCARFLEQEIDGGPWALGPTYSYCDPYLFLMARWMAAVGLSITAFPKLSAHHDAMLARASTQKVLDIHGLS
ncbi:glutathione S-transferase family protein [Tateyamaria sp.]|uniref:glutathione S-transferase family protein n=1 Tax=Tateyamaria sp. TaxID=1929288 RepID=UPI00329CCD5C